MELVLDETWQEYLTSGATIGRAIKDIAPLELLHTYQHFVTLIRVTNTMPPSSLRPKMFPHSKDNGDPGIKEQKLLHGVDACSKNWIGQLAKRVNPQPRFVLFAHGKIPARRREGTLLV